MLQIRSLAREIPWAEGMAKKKKNSVLWRFISELQEGLVNCKPPSLLLGSILNEILACTLETRKCTKMGGGRFKNKRKKKVNVE